MLPQNTYNTTPNFPESYIASLNTADRIYNLEVMDIHGNKITRHLGIFQGIFETRVIITTGYPIHVRIFIGLFNNNQNGLFCSAKFIIGYSNKLSLS